jgi:putative autotransporter adhesin-like protein
MDEGMAMTTAPTSLPHHPRLVPTWLAGAFVLALIAISIVFAVQREGSTDGGAGSGVPGSQVRHLASFSRIELAGANTVSISVGAAQLVTIRGDDNLLDRVTTTVADRTLTIGNRGSVRTNAPMSVDVAVPRLAVVSLSGSGTISFVGVRAPAFLVELSGAGTIQAAGSVNRSSATLSGTGTIDLGGLIARHATAVLHGSGTIDVHASGSLDATITGVGSIECAGSPPKIRRTITGTGAISA